MKKYFIEGVLIFFSVLSAFFLESYRVEQSKIELKDALMKELSFSIEEDLNQINEVGSILNESLDSAIYLMNDFLSDDKAEKKIIAQNLEKKYPYLNKYGSINTIVGSKPLNKFKKIKHLSPMLSLANAFNLEDMRNFKKK